MSLPGFGSHYHFLPDYGVAVIAFANRTYAPASKPCLKAMDILLNTVISSLALPQSPQSSKRGRTKSAN